MPQTWAKTWTISSPTTPVLWAWRPAYKAGLPNLARPLHPALSSMASPSCETSTITSDSPGFNTMSGWRTSKRCKAATRANKPRIHLKIQGNPINPRYPNSLIDPQGRSTDSNPRGSSSNPTDHRAMMNSRLSITSVTKASRFLMLSFKITYKGLSASIRILLRARKLTKYFNNF